MDEESSRVLIASSTDAYVLSLTGREEAKDKICGEEVGLHYVFSSDLGDILSGQPIYIWPLSFFETHVFYLNQSAKLDDTLFERRFDALTFFNPDVEREPVNAYISDYDPRNGYTLIPEDNGTTLQKERTSDLIYDALIRMEPSLDLEEVGCYMNATITRDDPYLNANLNAMNTYVQADIFTDYLGDTVELSGKEISQWVQQGPYTAMLDRGAIAEYVADKAREYDTYGKTYDFQTTAGEEKRIPSYSFGFRTDRNKETAELIQLIKEGQEAKRTPIYSLEGYNKGQKGVGDSYVEINLSAQHLYLYQKGELMLETDFVSGNVSNGNTTPGGIYGITYKEKDATLRGETYVSHVHYWMPFNGNIGMHDATWRSEFGGEIYLTNGSHGCVNLPLSAARDIFEYMEKGYPVVCYY
ncbi:MAG: L,D-transpeptidase/peptidoglycan binding protein [Lachnospiraceae bacterium]|nr:L,D-transpeptidase/peptidoglycan binding protein [Lachnospiraceae bacterium]